MPMAAHVKSYYDISAMKKDPQDDGLPKWWLMRGRGVGEHIAVTVCQGILFLECVRDEVKIKQTLDPVDGLEIFWFTPHIDIKISGSTVRAYLRNRRRR